MKKANPLAIGIFVVTATLLLFSGIIILGAGKFFQKTREYICFFDETVNGLDVGAPVKYKGVTLGKINKIYISNSSNIKTQKVMIIFSLIESNNIGYSLADDSGMDLGEKISMAIKEGLRAKLAYQSIVTGMLYIELDYFAKAGDEIVYNYEGTDYEEMPAVPSSALEEFTKKLATIADDVINMQLDEIGKNLNATLVTLNTKLSEVDTKNISDKTVALLDEVGAIVADADIKGSLTKVNKLLDDADSLVLSIEKDVSSISSKANETLTKGDVFLENMNAFTSRHSPFMVEFSLLLNTLRNTSQSAQSLIEYLERNPSSLIKGKALENTETK